MNKEITIYDLLGLIKDGKSPKKIKFDDTEYKYGNGYYYRMDNEVPKIFTNEYNILLCLNDEVEILEEDKPIIEKLNIESDSPTHFYIRNEYGTKCGLTKHSKMIADKLNEIIDYINRKEDK